MAESPTIEQLKVERPDIENFIEGNEANLSLDDYIAKALAQVKRDIEDVKNIKWTMVYDEDSGDYFKNTDDQEKNKDRLHNAILLLTIGFVFKDYSVKAVEGVWWDLWLAFREDYDRAINEMQLSIDWDESGEISEDEERDSTQIFLCR